MYFYFQGSGESRAESNQLLDNIYLGVSLPLYIYVFDNMRLIAFYTLFYEKIGKKMW